MRPIVLLTAAGLWLVPLLNTSLAREVKAAPPVKAATCNGDFGTSVLFEDSPSEAATQAKKDQKLVFLLHISGHFEDPKLT